MVQTRSTGTIAPRAYGVRLFMSPYVESVFVPPHSYLIAQLMLETPDEIRARLTDWAHRNGGSPKDVTESFARAVEKREGSRKILNMSRFKNRKKLLHVLPDMGRFGAVFSGQVRSKDDDPKREWYQFTIPEPPMRREVPISYPGATVETVQNLRAGEKIRGTTYVSPHLAAVELALVHDERTRASQEENITGLTPQDRKMKAGTPKLPFTFNFFKDPANLSRKERTLYDLVTDALVTLYLGKGTHYETDVELLGHSEIYGPELTNAVTSPRDLATFKVIRQGEVNRKSEEANTETGRRDASVRTLVNNLELYLERTRKYYSTGYCREFVGTPWEAVARRFQSSTDNPVYSIVTSDNHPPLVVKRDLGHKAAEWVDSRDMAQVQGMRRGADFAAFIGVKYESVDDATRRNSTVEIILPDVKLMSREYRVPRNLQAEYDALRAIIPNPRRP